MSRGHAPPPRSAGISIGGILALLAVVALAVVAWFALVDRSDPVERGAREQTTELQRGFDAAEARARLAALREEIEAGADEAELRERYEAVRRDLEAAYAGARDEAARAWGTLEPELDRLGEALAAGGDEALAPLDRLLDGLGGE